METSSAASFGLSPLHDPAGIMQDQARLIDSILIDAQVTSVVAPLKIDPEAESETLTYVLYGEPLQVLAETGSWQLVVSVTDGYLGWIDQRSVSGKVTEPTHTVCVPLTHRYEAPDLKTNPVKTLPLGAYVTATGSAENGFLPLVDGSWVFIRHLRVIGNYDDDPVAVAECFAGVPYLWGGRSVLGIDCSGLIQVSLAACGRRVHRDSGTQLDSLGNFLKEGEHPQRGDLAFFPGHVGWMLDSEYILHANATHMAVTIDRLEDVISWVAAQTTTPPFLGFKRL